MDLNDIYVSDCNDFMDQIPDSYINLIVTSPPYGKQRKYKGFTFDFERTAINCARIIKPGGVIVWVVADQVVNGSESGTSFRQALYFMSLGLNLYDTMIYAKSNYIPKNHKRYEQQFEYIFVFTKKKPSTFKPILVPCSFPNYKKNFARAGYGFKEGAFRRRDELTFTKSHKIHGNIWFYGTGNSRKNHPAIFPGPLAADQIRTWTNYLDIVFDPFSGSGTTCEEAKKLGRYYLGCDVGEEYVFDSQERLKLIEDYTDQLQ